MRSNDRIREQQDALTRDLADFETGVITPVIPGELQGWMENVAESFRRLSTRLTKHRENVHSIQFREIAEEDPGLIHRVEQMRESDQDVAARQLHLAARIAELNSKTKVAERDEAALVDELSQLVLDAQELVAGVRRQEMATQTWFSEAFIRDRGTVD